MRVQDGERMAGGGEARRRVAYHEAGHAVAHHFLGGTIQRLELGAVEYEAGISRGRCLGQFRLDAERRLFAEFVSLGGRREPRRRPFAAGHGFRRGRQPRDRRFAGRRREA